jgi:CheY-like chemotaxis protein
MKNILVINDDIFGIIISDGLEQLGYSVDIANGVKSALGLMESNIYDVVLTDKNMPGLNGSEEGGFDIANYARSHLPKTKVIMMTGDLSFGENHVNRPGVSLLVFKPFSVTDLKDKIDHLLGR